MIKQCALQAVAIVFLSLSSVAIAAEGSTTGVAEEQPLNEVVVTATKRDTKLEETPVAITAFTADQIQRQRIYNFTDIAERAPGLEFIPYSRQEAYVSIRGTTTNSAANACPRIRAPNR